MKCVTAVIFFVGALTHEAWSKPNEYTSSNQLSISDLGTNVGGRLGSALGQTVGAGLDSVQQLGAGVLGLGAGLVGGVGSGLGSGLQAGLNPGRGDQREGGRVSVDLNAGVNGQGKLNVGANVNNDRGAYPNNYPINTNNVGNGMASGVELGYRPSAENGYGAIYGGSNVGVSQRMQYPGANVYTDYGHPNSYPYNPQGVVYGGIYAPGHGYQTVVPPVYHGTYPYNTPYNMNDQRIGVSYGPGYRPAVEYVNGGYYSPARHYPGQGYQNIGAHAYPDHVYPHYFPSNVNNVRLDGGSVNGGGFDSGARSHRLHNTERNMNVNNNRASYPNGYPVNSNNAGPRNVHANYDARLEYGNGIGVTSGNGLGNRANNRFDAEAGARRDVDVVPVSRRRQEPNYDDNNETAFDVRLGIGSSDTHITGPTDKARFEPKIDGRLESGSRVGVDAAVGNRARPIVDSGVEGGEVTSVAAGTESDAGATVDNDAGIAIRV